MKKRLSIATFKKMKQEKQPITVMTAYDFTQARLAELGGIDCILVGDSLGNVVLGYETTIPVTLDNMVYHAKAVSKGATKTFIVADMPFMTYGVSIEQTLLNAAKIMQHGQVQALKLEGGVEIKEHVKALVQAGIPVMGHIGLTPQSVHQLSGYRVQGKTVEDAQRLLNEAKALQEAGAFAIVLELVEASCARYITSELSIPTIGIGAGVNCDGQVLVFHDLLQFEPEPHPKKFVKTYANIGQVATEAIQGYVKDVKALKFPEEKHSFIQEDNKSAIYGGDR